MTSQNISRQVFLREKQISINNAAEGSGQIPATVNLAHITAEQEAEQLHRLAPEALSLSRPQGLALVTNKLRELLGESATAHTNLNHSPPNGE